MTRTAEEAATRDMGEITSGARYIATPKTTEYQQSIRPNELIDWDKELAESSIRHTELLDWLKEANAATEEFLYEPDPNKPMGFWSWTHEIGCFYGIIVELVTCDPTFYAQMRFSPWGYDCTKYRAMITGAPEVMATEKPGCVRTFHFENGQIVTRNEIMDEVARITSDSY